MLTDDTSAPPEPSSRKSVFSRPGVVVGSLLLVCGLIAVISLWWLDRDHPLPLQTANPQQLNHPVLLLESRHFARVVTDRYGRTLRAFPDSEGVWRYPVNLDQVSPHYLNALIQYEDRWFWHHPGVNPLALIRAAWQNVLCGCVISGGSTLTMQVARRLFPHSKTFSGKLSQALRALQLEWHLSKEQILTLYLNYAPMGGVIEGVEAAAQMYLDKPAHELSLAEGALLAVLPQAPSRLRPDRHPERAIAARNKVLQRLLSFGAISPDDFDQAKLESLFAYQPHVPQAAPLLARRLTQGSDHAVIQTTLDADLQRELEVLLEQDIRRFPPRHSAAILVLDNQTHEVRAYLGSAQFLNQQRFGHVDMVQASRSPGSTMKPFIYGLALDDGLIHGASLLQDVPRLRADYRPDNFASDFSGPVSPRTALRYSLNLPAVQVLEALTPERLVAALSTAGANYQLPQAGKPNLALALGAGGMRLWDLVMLYSSLAAQGQVVEPKVLASTAAARSLWLMSPEAAWVTADLIRNPFPSQADSSALVQRAPSLSWKTGTSYGYRDAWALGVTPGYTIGVWLGRPDGTPSPGHYGALTALPLLKRLFDHLDRNPGWPDRPESVTQATVCWPLGRLLSDTSPEHCHQQQSGWMLREQVPPTLRSLSNPNAMPNPLPVRLSPQGLRINDHCNLGVQKVSRLALWPTPLEPWIPARWRLQHQMPEADPRCPTDTPTDQLPSLPLRITGIEPDSRVRSALQHQGGSQDFPTLTLGSQGGLGWRDWYLNGRYLNTSAVNSSLQIQTTQLGKQTLLVIDELGNAERLTFYVE